MPSYRRQKHWDALRGIAALVVVTMHFFAAFYPYTIAGAGAGYPLHSPWEKLAFIPPLGLFINGHLAVALFFILSGYVLSYRYLGAKQPKIALIHALLKRPLRLGGLVWFSLLLVFCCWWFGGFYNVELAEVTGSKAWFGQLWTEDFPRLKQFYDFCLALFSNRGSLHNPPLWTIYIELYGSLLIFIYLLFIADYKYRLILHLIIIIALYHSLYQGFWIGLLLADLHKNYRPFLSRCTVFRWPIFLCFFLLSAYPHYVSSTGLEETIYRFLPDSKPLITGYALWAACLLFFWVLISAKIQHYLQHPVLCFLGRISYSVYVLHFIILGSFASGLFLQLYPLLGYFSTFILVYLLSLVLLVFFSYWTTIKLDEPLTAFATRLVNRLPVLIKTI